MNFSVIFSVVISKQILRLRIVHVKGFSLLLLISISFREGFDKKEIEIETSFSIAMKFKYMCPLGHIRSTPTFKDLALSLVFKKRLWATRKWTNVVLNRTVVVDSDRCFDNLCGSRLRRQSELYHVSWWYCTLVINLIGHYVNVSNCCWIFWIIVDTIKSKLYRNRFQKSAMSSDFSTNTFDIHGCYTTTLRTPECSLLTGISFFPFFFLTALCIIVID